MQINGMTKLTLSALLVFAVSQIQTLIAYLQGLDGKPIDWLVIASTVLSSLALALKDSVTYKAILPTDENRNPASSAVSRSVTDSGYVLSPRSLNSLIDVHPALIRVVELALKKSPYDFVITWGVRTEKQQRVLFEGGKSRTMDSRHLTGHAIDVAALVNNAVTWEHEYYKAIADAFKNAAFELGIDIEWGGDWPGFVDATHFQLSREAYP